MQRYPPYMTTERSQHDSGPPLEVYMGLRVERKEGELKDTAGAVPLPTPLAGIDRQGAADLMAIRRSKWPLVSPVFGSLTAAGMGFVRVGILEGRRSRLAVPGRDDGHLVRGGVEMQHVGCGCQRRWEQQVISTLSLFICWGGSWWYLGCLDTW